MLSLLVASWDRSLEERGLMALGGCEGCVQRGVGVPGVRGSVPQPLKPARLGEVRVPVAANSRAVRVVDGDAVPHIVENCLGLRGR